MIFSVKAFLAGLAASATAGSGAGAAVVTLNPVADAFVDSAQPSSNFGGAGALGISAPGLPEGEFQTVMRFDASSALSTFNATFGAGQWTIQSITLQLTATPPNNSIFNAQPGARHYTSSPARLATDGAIRAPGPGKRAHAPARLSPSPRSEPIPNA